MKTGSPSILERNLFVNTKRLFIDPMNYHVESYCSQIWQYISRELGILEVMLFFRKCISESYRFFDASGRPIYFSADPLPRAPKTAMAKLTFDML